MSKAVFKLGKDKMLAIVSVLADRKQTNKQTRKQDGKTIITGGLLPLLVFFFTLFTCCHSIRLQCVLFYNNLVEQYKSF